MSGLGALYRAAVSSTGECPGCDVELQVVGPWPPKAGEVTQLNYLHDAGCPASEEWS